MKTEEKNKARELRIQGIPIKKISKILNVSKSTVSLWVKDIKLTEEQIEANKLLNPIYNVSLNGAQARAEKARLQRIEFQEFGKTRAKENNPLHQMGCMLYWGEGDKNKNSCGLANSDPNLLKFFLKFLIESYNISTDMITFRVNCHLNNDLTIEQIENYWLNILNLPKSCLRKPIINTKSSASKEKKDKNILPYGTGHIRVNSTELVQNIFGAIQEYGNFINKEWLD